MEASAARRPTHPGPRVPARLLRLASDDRLVDYIRNGSEPAFEAVFDRHHRGILAFCRHMLGSADEAEDAVQHTFMAAYRSLVGSSRPIQLRPWLYTIARNRCLSILRARRERPVRDLDELPTENLSAEVQRRQDLRDLLRDVGDLPEEQRAALVLAEVGGVSHDEISQVLGVQREKVKALVFQARSSLIASRDARETPCTEVRAQLAELRGGALRRNTLRRHLKICPGCREFRAALQDQRKMLALALPVVPTLALKHGVMAGALGSGAAAAGGAAAGGAAAGGSLLAGSGASVTAKVLAVAALAGGGAAGVKAVAPGEPVSSRTAGQDAREQRGGSAGSHERRSGATAPAAVGMAEQSDGRPGTRMRLGEQRSEGRRGVERRSERADERAAGPNLGAQPDNERGLEQRDAGGPRERPQSSEREATVNGPSVEKLAKPAPTPRAAPTPQPQPEKSQKPATPAPAPAPAVTPEVTPPVVPTPPSNANGGGGANPKE